MEDHALTSGGDKGASVVRFTTNGEAGSVACSQGNGLSTPKNGVKLHSNGKNSAQVSSAKQLVLKDNNNNGPSGGGERRMDGGYRAWLIVLSSFLCNGLIFGVINSYSLIYLRLQKTLEDNGDPDSSSKAGLLLFQFYSGFTAKDCPLLNFGLGLI